MTIFDEIRAYLKKTGITQAELGRAITRDRGFITKLVNEQLLLTPEREAMIRKFIFDNPDYCPAPTPVIRYDPSGSGIGVAGNPDLWMKDAAIGSAMLLKALRRYYAARAAA
ncbi:MAG: hypothetical protein WBL20_14390 [Sphingobium sp.]|uniref:hypothetical protein n=1 Tax=Sphingobium sp. TaxID=1912891 RepID=UPI002E1EF1CD